jgi:hypothetical protein
MSNVTLEMELKEIIRELESELCMANHKLEILEPEVDNYEYLYEADGVAE